MTLTLHPIKARDQLILVLILIVAAILRFGDLANAEFFHDEAMLSLLAQDMTRGGDFPLQGILSSVGIPNPPTSVYVMAIPYIFTDDPLIATGFIALLNVIGVGVLWHIGHRYFSRTVGLIAGLAYAVSPWAVLYSRKIWAQDFHTPLILIAIALGIYGFLEGRRWAQVVCLPLLLFALQIHFAAWAILPVYLVMLWIGRHKIAWRAVMLSAGLGVLTLLPYILGLSATLTQDPTRISDAIGRSNQGIGVSLDALRFNAYLMTGLGVETWIAPNQSADLLANAPIATPLWMLNGALMLIGLIGVGWKYRPLASLVIAWAFVPIAIFSLTWTTTYPHYFVHVIPVWMLLIAIGVELLIAGAVYLVMIDQPRKRAPLVRIVVMTAIAVVWLMQAVWWRGAMRYVEVTPISLGAGTSGYSTPMRYLLAVRDAVRDADDVIVLSDGQTVLLDVEPARWPVLLRDSAACVRTLPGDGFWVLPSGPFAAIVTPSAGENAAFYQHDAGERFAARGDEGYAVYRWERAPEWDAGETVSSVFENGVRLIGYRVDGERLMLTWELAGEQTIDYQYFVHFLDARGEVITQRDQPFWAGRHWCVGDRLVSWVMMPLDQGVNLRIGFYVLEREGTYRAVDVLDMMGNPVGNWIELALDSSVR
jgi:hypothetical protein